MINLISGSKFRKTAFSALNTVSTEARLRYLDNLSSKNRDAFLKAERRLQSESSKCGADVYVHIKPASIEEQSRYLLNEDGCVLKAVVVRKSDGAADIYEDAIGAGDSSFVNPMLATSDEAKAKNCLGARVLEGLTKYVKAFTKAEPVNQTISGPVDTAFIAYDPKFAL